MRTVLWILLVGCLVEAQEHPIAFQNAKLITISNGDIESGTLLVHRGKIQSAGPSDQIELPENCTIIDLSGKIIMPGLVDTHSHIGGGRAADRSSPMQGDVRIYESINIRASRFQKARAGGLTTINVMPGSGYLMSGQTVYLKLREGRILEDFTIDDGQGRFLGGMKMANGTNSMRKPPFPGTRAKSAALVRAKFQKAIEYRKKLESSKGEDQKALKRDLELEAIVEILEKKRTVHFHTHRHDDILTILRLASEFDFEVVLHHMSEAWMVADELAAAKVPCSILIVDSPGGKLEAMNLTFETGKVLEEAGLDVAFHTDDPITDSRHFLRNAAMGVRYGMSRAKALEALTMAGARMLKLDDRIGSLEKGKDADFIILSGDPLSTFTKVLETWVEGKKMFDRSDPTDLLYATGGLGATHDEGHVHACGIHFSEVD